MVKAHSLLYAIYVCLIVSILCVALLYFANLYNLLNQYYNSHEELYIQNQSTLNYALSNAGDSEENLTNAETGLTSGFEIKPYGLLNIAIVKSSLKNDTVTSAHFIGKYPETKLAMFLPGLSNPISCSGDVKLIGDKKLPSKFIEERHINNLPTHLSTTGTITISDNILPEINPDFQKFAETKTNQLLQLKDVERTNDTIYYNSFLHKAIEIELPTGFLQNITFKGNFILYVRDSISIRKNVVLEDVIVKAPIIKIENDFKGSLQAFATKKIEIGTNVTLRYPSVLTVYNNTDEKSALLVNESSTIYGAVVLFGSSLVNIDYNTIILMDKTKLIGDIYCTGKLMTGGKIYGSVYTNRFFAKTLAGTYENCIINTEIDVGKRPDYFVSVPLFKSDNKIYGTFKKIF